MRVPLRATGVVLLVATMTPRHRGWWLPWLCANSIVGGAYMYVERDTLVREGVRVLGRRWTPRRTEHVHLVNVVVHALLPWALLGAHEHRRRHAREDNENARELSLGIALAMQAAGACALDLDALYPVSRLPLSAYVAAHTVVVATAVLRGWAGKSAVEGKGWR